MANLDVYELLKKQTLTEEEECSLASIDELDLSKAHISDLAPLSSLKTLQSLNLSFTKVTDLSPLSSLKTLRSLNLSFTKVTDLSPLSSLKTLRSLDLTGTEISDLSPLSSLIALQVLDLSFVKISDLMPLSNLRELQFLDLSNTEVSDLSPLSGLSSLQELTLFFTKVTDLAPLSSLSGLRQFMLLDAPVSDISPLAALSNLKSLLLSGILAVDLAPLSSLSGLRKFMLLDAPVSDISPLAALSNLEGLVLSGILPVDLAPLSGLHGLQSLELSGTAVSDLAPLSGLHGLRSLGLAYTAVSDLRPISELTGIEKLDLRGLHLVDYPQELLKFKLPFVFEEHLTTKGCNCNLYNTTFRLMPASLFHQSPEFINAYYEQESIQPREAKVIFIGDGHRGKTYAMERLIKDGVKGDYPTRETHGINIREYKAPIGDEHIRIWDFGGQQVMHSMHTCILTDRTGYVVFLSSRADEGADSGERWIRAIRSFAPESKILVFVNLWDDDVYQGLAEDLRWKYGVDVAYCSVCHASQEEFNREFRDSLIRLARSLDSLDIQLPVSWNGVREEIRSMGSAQENPSYTIKQGEYLDICRRHGIDDESLAGWLLEWMRDLGDCFFYDSETLSGRQVLEPRWLTRAIYTIICYGQRHAEEDGIIKRSVIEEILGNKEYYKSLVNFDVDDPEQHVMPNYTKEQVAYILGVMEEFLLSYRVDEHSEFIPSITSEEGGDLAPASFTESRSFILEYEYLPDTLVQRLMVKSMREGLKPGKVFRRGLQLRFPADGTDISVDARSGSSIEVTLYKTEESWVPELAWQWVRGHILDLGQAMNIKPTSEIVIIDYEDRRGIQRIKEVSIDDLFEYLEAGDQEYQAPGKTFDIHKLLCDTYGQDAANVALDVVAKGVDRNSFKEALGADGANVINVFNIETANIGNMTSADVLHGGICVRNGSV